MPTVHVVTLVVVPWDAPYFFGLHQEFPVAGRILGARKSFIVARALGLYFLEERQGP